MGYIREQINVIKERDPAIKSSIEVLLYPSFYALLFHKVGHFFYKHHRYFIARLISQLARGLTGIEIHPGATIGKGLFIDHGMGVVIGETCEIGDNVTIYHGVTLGGTGKDHGKRHPTIGNNVLISTGAKVLGPFKVGDNSRIAANAVVLQEIPPDSTVVGIPGKVVRIQGKRINPNEELDQVRIPDPIKIEICSLRDTISDLEDQVKTLEGYMDLEQYARPDLDDSLEISASNEFCERLQEIEFSRQHKCRCNQKDCETKAICDEYNIEINYKTEDDNDQDL